MGLDYSTTDIEDVVFDICRDIGKIAEYNGDDTPKELKQEHGEEFSDGGGTQGLINTAEALSTITIPYFTLSSFAKSFWKGEVISHSLIRKGVDYLLDGYKVKDPDAHGTHGFGGTPYIDFRYRGEDETDQIDEISKNLDFVDAASFVITALTDIKAIHLHREVLIQDCEIESTVEPLLSKDRIDEIDKRLVAAFQVIDKANTGPGNGFCYTSEEIESDKIDFVYFTWSVLEMLESLTPYLKCKAHVLPVRLLKKRVTGGEDLEVWFSKLTADKLSFLTGRYLSPKDSPDKYIGDKQVIFKSDAGDDTSLFYNIFAVLALLQVKNNEYEEIAKAVKFIMKNAKTQGRTLKKGCAFWLEGDLAEKYQIEKEWEERAFEPLYLKTLSLFKIKFATKIDASFAKEIEEARASLLDSLLKKKAKGAGRRSCFKLDGKEIDSVWDGAKYSIYYTERTMEALCRYYESMSDDIPNYSKDIGAFYAEKEGAETAAVAGGMAPALMPASVNITIDSGILSGQIKAQIDQEVANAVSKVSSSINIEGIKDEIISNIMEDLEQEIQERVKATFLHRKGTFFEDMLGEVDKGKKDVDQDYMYVLDGIFDAFTTLVAHRELDNDDNEINQKLDTFAYDLVRLLRWDCGRNEEEIKVTLQGVGDMIKFFNKDKEELNFIKTAESLLNNKIIGTKES